MNRNIVLISLYDPWAFGVCTLHSVLNKAGFNPISVFFKTTTATTTHIKPTITEIELLKSLVFAQNPLFVGISLRSTNYQIAKKITQELRKVLNVPIIWGGIHPTISPEQCITEADIVCVGEGEGALVELADALISGKKIKDILNLWAGSEIKNDVRDLINLDRIPFPDFSGNNKWLVEDNKLRNLIGAEKDRVSYGIMTTRGCLFGCTFCCNYNLRKLYQNKGKYVRRRSVENVIQELVDAKERFTNLKEIRFIDDVFTFDKTWIMGFCKQYKEKISLPFHCLCHPRYTDEEIISELKDVGLISVIMGIQTGSEQFKQEGYGRAESNPDIIKADKLLYVHGIKRYYDIILNNPMENWRDRKDTLNLLLQLQRPFELHTFSLTHFPHTKMTERLLKDGHILPNDVEDQKMNTWKGTFCSVLDERHSNESLFWENLFYLSQITWMPKSVIWKLSSWEYYRKHPIYLTKLLKLTCFNIYSVQDGKFDNVRRKIILGLSNPKMVLSYIRALPIVYIPRKLKDIKLKDNDDVTAE